jgi:hypothetical protein
MKELIILFVPAWIVSSGIEISKHRWQTGAGIGLSRGEEYPESSFSMSQAGFKMAMDVVGWKGSTNMTWTYNCSLCFVI